MVYVRVSPPPPRVNLWEFEQVGEPSPHDLVVIYLENGDRLHVVRDKTRAWRPVKRLMPQSLRDILAMDGDGFTVSHGVGGIRSGCEGSPLVLKLRASVWGMGDEMVFVSDNLITMIRSQTPGVALATQLRGELALWNGNDARDYARSLKARTTK